MGRARFRNAAEVTEAYAKASTAHGVRRAGHAVHGSARLFWLILFVVGFAAFIYLTIALVAEYRNYSTKTESRREGGFRPFPSVTICGLNSDPVATTTNPSATASYKADKLAACEERCRRVRTVELCGCHNPSLGPKDEAETKDCDAVIDPPKHQCSLHTLKEFNVWNNRSCPGCAFSTEAGNRTRAIKYCSFDGHLCNPATTFTTASLSPRYGLCHTFSNNTLITKPGPDYGLALILDAERLEFVGASSEGEGFRVSIHPPGSVPAVEVDGLNIPTGMEATITIQENERERLGGVYGACDNSDGATSLMCSSDSCTPPCKETHYQKVTSFTTYPTHNHKESLRNLLASVPGADAVHPDFAQLAAVKIFYSELGKSILAQTPAHTIAKLLTQIGGISALLCGVSLLTCCEFGQMLISYSTAHEPPPDERPFTASSDSRPSTALPQPSPHPTTHSVQDHPMVEHQEF